MIAACLKWVDHKPDVDPLTGIVGHDARTSGASDADWAALEWALRLGEAWHHPVTAVTAGPPEAERLLHDALAAGATAAVRADVASASPSATVAAAIAASFAEPPVLVLCGVWSIDRGSASVPAFLAAELDAAQALGLITLAAEGDHVIGERRLDRGARERIRVALPAVCSVEGGSARLRRASLPGVLAGAGGPITVTAGSAHPSPSAPVRTRPYRPRAKELRAPDPGLSARERIVALSGVMARADRARTLVLGPGAAADALLATLREWGYLT